MSACEYCNGECGGHCSDARYNRDIDEAYQRGRDEERAAVVAWLRDTAREYRASADMSATAIEKGEHEVKR